MKKKLFDWHVIGKRVFIQTGNYAQGTSKNDIEIPKWFATK